MSGGARRGIAGAFAFACALAVAAPAGAAPGLVPHHALYEMSRKSSTIESDVVGVQGRMEIGIEASCDGWRIEQFLGFHVVSADESVYEHLAHLSGFESAGGREFWFNTRTWENRELVEELSGVARLEAPGGAGTARLAKPVETRRELPEGTLFPNRHIEALIEAARRGERQFSRPVYDGSTLESPYEVAAAIGERRRPNPPGFPALADAWAWPMQLAYYPIPSRSATPEFQMQVLLFENGVAGDMVYDYGHFTVTVKLEELELRLRPACP